MKPFKETKVGKVLASKGLDKILDAASALGIPGAGAINMAKDLVLGDPTIAPSVKEEISLAAKSDLEEFDKVLADIHSARGREVELAKAGVKNTTQNILAFIAVLGFLFSVMSLIVLSLIFGFGRIPNELTLLIGTVLGALASQSNAVYAYFFGSTRTSREKNEMLFNLSNKQ